MPTRNKKDYKKRHPDSSYDTKYPYNQVVVTEAGHEFHWDNTPGHERIREAHMSGTYYEISPDGKRVSQVVGDQVEYVKGGHTSTVDKNVDIKHGGSVRTSSHGDHHTEVKGSATTAIDKDQSTTVGGDTNKAMKGDLAVGIVGKSTTTIGKNIKVKGDAEMDMKIDANALMEFGDELTIRAVSKITLQCGGSTIVMTPGNITIHAQDIKTESGGDTFLEAGGDVKTHGARTVVQEGGQQLTPTSDIFS